jgi:hypothetical protein
LKTPSKRRILKLGSAVEKVLNYNDMKKKRKLNCWDFKNCGRRVGGHLAKKIGTCPAATEKKLHGIHGGKNAGRACWAVAGTMCEGKAEGTYAKSFTGCRLCDFYKAVKEEEGEHFVKSRELRKKCKS